MKNLYTRKRRLVVSKETVRSLARVDIDLGRVIGGAPSNYDGWKCSTYGRDLTDGDVLSHCACTSAC